MPSLLCSRLRHRQHKLSITKNRKPKFLPSKREILVKSPISSALIKEFQDISINQIERLKDSYEDILYDDNFCCLRRDQLELKCYYFPTAQSKRIAPAKIRFIQFEKQAYQSQINSVKGWGMSANYVWWACDISRCFHSENSDFFNVTIDTGGRILKGFTVRDIVAFLNALRSLLNSDTQIVENLELLRSKPPSCGSL